VRYLRWTPLLLRWMKGVVSEESWDEERDQAIWFDLHHDAIAL